MGSKKIRPVTPGMRGQVATDFKDITKKKPEKSLLESKKSSGAVSYTHLTLPTTIEV